METFPTATVPGTLHDIDFMVKDGKRFVGTQDKAINPDLLRAQARRANGTVTEGAWSHVPFLSQPRVVVKVIEDAAKHASDRAN